MRTHQLFSSGGIILMSLWCLAWEGYIAPLNPDGSWLILKCIPIILPLTGMLRNTLRAYQYAVLLVFPYFIAEDMFPKRVGLPSASPMQVRKSSISTYGEPASGITDSVFSVVADTGGTVLTRAVTPGTISIPLAMSLAICWTLPFRE